ncbi:MULTISPECIES: alpha-amylase family protein [unclassified Actinomyces]|uniref:alpha-amylase family protein n=1 Tax=unclassified Actinomyces TaxID=2609248 RepID=UPI00201735AF|nr:MULTISPECIES: alpha-amylase family protein [unclassified Actinomyces]MCL3777847.1 alpha-amylase [Actinomyces sp. AC-20-1]MCL3790612.1 alpha-amylase [Actinomyces sp. 187325]MCL3792865.1 alpha-amylase [Actinomyces sp. 186855]MCL3795329.1 alpha-amylase [Actinomyces sp. 217892]
MSATAPSRSPWSTDSAVPEQVRSAVDAVLDDAALPEPEREVLATRVERWYPDIADGLVTLYGERGDDAVRTTAVHLLTEAATAWVARDPQLRRLDLARTLDPTWVQDPSRIGYAAYTERFAGDLRGVEERIDYLRELGVTYLHLMPLLTPRPGDSDGGYAVADYRSVRADLGDMEDLAHLAGRLREHGMSLVIDLVLNHVAREHEWAVRARAGEQRYRDYFHIYPDRTEPDEYERTLPEIFPDFAPGSFTWDEEAAGWVWTTFNSFQWDVNWRNPHVMEEYASIVLDLANRGVEVLRLDAIAFTIKRKGTDCQGQPEVHAITQVLRALTRIACPAVDLKAEAIVAPTELLQYLGQGRYTGKVSDLAYHNSLMVQVWSMLASRNVRLAARALSCLPVEPATATWITYIRCHDDIGWAIDDDDAEAVGLNGFWHRQFLADWYRGVYPMSDARGLVFQHNPVTQDRRITGTAASLIGIEAAAEAVEGIGDDTPLWREEELRTWLAQRLDALRLANAIIYGWGGVPVLWSGDEVGQLNDPNWDTEPGHEADSRWAGRPVLSETLVAQRHDPTTVAGRVFSDLVRMGRVRASLPQLRADVRTLVAPVDDDGVLVTFRDHPRGSFVGVYNVTPDWRSVPASRLAGYGVLGAVDVLTDTVPEWSTTLEGAGDGLVPVPPYAAWWLVRATD